MNKKRCAIVFLDVSDSTQHYEQLGDELAKHCIGKCLEHMAVIIRAHGGVVIQAIGYELGQVRGAISLSREF